MRVNTKYITQYKVHNSTEGTSSDWVSVSWCFSSANQPPLFVDFTEALQVSFFFRLYHRIPYPLHGSKATKTFLLLNLQLVQMFHMLRLPQAACSSGQRARKCANNSADRAGRLRRDSFHACLAKLSTHDSSTAARHVVFYLTWSRHKKPELDTVFIIRPRYVGAAL